MDHRDDLSVVANYCLAVARGTISTDRFQPILDTGLATTASNFYIAESPYRMPLHTNELFGKFEAKEYDYKLLDLYNKN